jgi:hypothetical protein
LPDGTEFDVAQEGSRIVGTWEINGSKHFIRGDVINSAVKGTIGHKSQFLLDSEEKRIFCYLGEEPGRLHLLVVGDQDAKHKIIICSINDGVLKLGSPGTEAKKLPGPQSA